MSNATLRPDTIERLERRLAAEQADRRLPSLVAGVVRDGRLVWSGSAGVVDGAAPTPTTQYRIGSITKTFVAACVLRLRDEGRLDLDDRVRDHVADAPVGDATVAQLLSHASGLRAETAGPWWERTAGIPWDRLVATIEPALRHRPGRRFHYSNVGYAVLGELVARERGAAWHEVVREELLEPLGMTDTTLRPRPPFAPGFAVHPFADALLAEPEHDAGAMAPAGQLWSTVPDLARWAACLAGHHPDVLPADTLAEASRPLVIDDRPGEPWTAGYGLGLQVWNRDGRRSIGHGGSMPGFLAAVQVDADHGDAALVATNTTAGLSGTLVTDLLDLLQEHEPAAPAPWQPGGVPPAALELAGFWYQGPTPLTITARAGGELELAGVDLPVRASRFVPEDDGTWTGLDGYYAGETLRPVRAADGRLASLDVASFVFTRSPYDPDADVPGGVAPAGWR